jgi:hypothetical protein
VALKPNIARVLDEPLIILAKIRFAVEEKMPCGVLAVVIVA